MDTAANNESRRKLSRGRLTWIILSLLAIVLSWWGVSDLESGLQIKRFTKEGIPLIFMAPDNAANVPGVIVAHGFSGSKQLMLGYGYGLAHAGYGALLLDLAGHGANSGVMDSEGDRLQGSINIAYSELTAHPSIDGSRIGLLGHSMGSGAVMRAGIENPDRYRAVVAVSPTGAEVTDSLPQNLLLQAGSWESPFIENAQELLTKAGGPNDDFDAGLARRFVEISNVEHISILFGPASRNLAIEWLNSSFGINNETPYRDSRMIWYGLHALGWLSLGLALRPYLPSAIDIGRRRSSTRQWLGLVLGSAAAIVFLALMNRLISLSDFLGILVGGGLGVWLLVMGSIWLGIGFRPRIPALQSLLGGIGLFVFLWLALGIMAQATWLQWFLIPQRLLLWPILSLACLPWNLSAGYAINQGTFLRRAGWWLGQSVVLTMGLVLTASIVPGMFVLILIAPALPLVLAAESIAGSAFDDPWAYGLGGAFFFGWLIVALFPLV